LTVEQLEEKLNARNENFENKNKSATINSRLGVL